MTNEFEIKTIAGLNVYEVSMVDGDGVLMQGPDFQYKQREHFQHELKSFLTSTELLHQILKELDPNKFGTHVFDESTMIIYDFIVDNYNLFYQLTLDKAVQMTRFIFDKMDNKVRNITIQKYSTTAIHLGHQVSNLLNQLESLTIMQETSNIVKLRLVSDVDVITHMNELTKLHPDFTFVIYSVPRFNYDEPNHRYFQNGAELFPNNFENKLKDMTDDEIRKTMNELTKKTYDINLTYVFDIGSHFIDPKVANTPEGKQLLEDIDLTSKELRRRGLIPSIAEFDKFLKSNNAKTYAEVLLREIPNNGRL